MIYMKISYIYFNENKMKWRKRFLVAGCSDENRLLSGDEINRINWQSRCEWSDDYYYWDDVNLPNSDKLAILKLAYDSESYKYYDSEQKLKSIEYSNCWLRYAIIRDHIQLLKNKVYFNGEKNRVYIKSDGWNYPKERDFMAQVLVLDYIKNGYLEQNKSVDPTTPYSICNYGVFELAKIVTTTKTFGVGYKYNHSTQNYSFEDRRNYNLTLYGVSRINIVESINNTTVSFLNYGEKQLTLFRPEYGNEFIKYVYELREGIDYLVKTAEEFNDEYKKINADRLLEIYYGDTDWIHDGGNNRSWRISKSYDLVQPNETTIYALE